VIRLLTRLTLPKPGDERVLEGLQRPKIPRLQIERFPKGVDGTHIDVALGPDLEKAARLYVSALLQEGLEQIWEETLTPTSEQVVDLFREQVREHHRVAVSQAQAASSLEQVQLFQLSLLKLVLQQVDAGLSKVRKDLDDERALRERQNHSKSLQLHRQSALLSRHGAHVRYRTAQLVLREINRLEHASMRNLRHSVLGRSWPVAEAMLHNPILARDGIGSLRDFKDSYPLLLYERSVAVEVGRCLFAALSEWLPDELANPRRNDAPATGSTDAPAAREHLEIAQWTRQLLGERERSDDLRTWVDDPDNLVALMGGTSAAWPHAGPWAPRDFSGLQRHLSGRFGRSLGRAGLLRKVSAAYATQALYPTLGLADGEAPVFDYLAGQIDRRVLQRRLEAQNQGVDVERLIRRLDEGHRSFRRDARHRRGPMLARLAGDFGRLRRDIKLAMPVFESLSRIRLLNDPDTLQLSRSHETLQVFCPQTQPADMRGNLLGHAIVRVEIRGCSDLAIRMTRRGLKPAAHFSRYLYDPVTGLLPRFGALKLSTEAGSLLLLTQQHAGDGTEQLAVARACILAMEVMRLTSAMNAEGERMGLPPLECSIGLVYADGAPAYLYDQSRRVLVSPALTLARRMSSCHALFRRSCSLPAGRGVCVAAALDASATGNGVGELVRYNVNGIELDEAAFIQINSELAMRKVRLRDPQLGRPVKLYVGRCADTQGDLHWLAIRQQPVKLWMGRDVMEAPADEGRAYYELVTDRRMLQNLAAKLDTGGEGRAETVPSARH